jgi:hypothetical protein
MFACVKTHACKIMQIPKTLGTCAYACIHTYTHHNIHTQASNCSHATTTTRVQFPLDPSKRRHLVPGTPSGVPTSVHTSGALFLGHADDTTDRHENMAGDSSPAKRSCGAANKAVSERSNGPKNVSERPKSLSKRLHLDRWMPHRSRDRAASVDETGTQRQPTCASPTQTAGRRQLAQSTEPCVLTHAVTGVVSLFRGHVNERASSDERAGAAARTAHTSPLHMENHMAWGSSHTSPNNSSSSFDFESESPYPHSDREALWHDTPNRPAHGDRDVAWLDGSQRVSSSHGAHNHHHAANTLSSSENRGVSHHHYQQQQQQQHVGNRLAYSSRELQGREISSRPSLCGYMDARGEAQHADSRTACAVDNVISIENAPSTEVRRQSAPSRAAVAVIRNQTHTEDVVGTGAAHIDSHALGNRAVHKPAHREVLRSSEVALGGVHARSRGRWSASVRANVMASMLPGGAPRCDVCFVFDVLV